MSEIRIVRPHTDTDDFHEDIWLGDSVKLDSLGRKHPNGHHRWAPIVCNNTECDFLVLVSEGAIVEWAWAAGR